MSDREREAEEGGGVKKLKSGGREKIGGNISYGKVEEKLVGGKSWLK